MIVDEPSNSGPLKVGDEFLEFEIRALIGYGDHAFVYDGFDPLLNRSVAIKVIPDPPNSRRDLVQRALVQAPLLRDLQHPNLVSVYDVGTIGVELVYIVMERLTGHTLRNVLLGPQPLSHLDLLSIGAQIAEGMAWAHSQGLLHRDLKPENVFIIEGNAVKVINCGITSLVVPSGMTTERDWLRGTLLYMSPEHVQGFGVTALSDIYALGTLLYEAFAGCPPCLMDAENLSLDDVAWRQISYVPPQLDELLPEVPGSVARTIQQMLAKEAVLRFGTMDEVAQRLRACHHELVAESRGGDPYPPDERPFIQFPSTALGMRAADAPETAIAGRGDAIAGRGDACLAPATHRKPQPNRVTWAIVAGIIFGIIITVYVNWAPRSDRIPVPGPQVNSGIPGASARSTSLQSAGPTGVEGSLSDAKNQTKINTYQSNSANANPAPLPVVKPIQSRGSEAKAKGKGNSSRAGELVF